MHSWPRVLFVPRPDQFSLPLSPGLAFPGPSLQGGCFMSPGRVTLSTHLGMVTHLSALPWWQNP